MDFRFHIWLFCAIILATIFSNNVSLSILIDRRIVGVAHVEDFESIADASKRATCERRALEFAKLILKERRKFQDIAEVVSAIGKVQ